MVSEFFWEVNMTMLEKKKSTFNQFIQIILLQFHWSQSTGYERSPTPNWQGLNFTSGPPPSPWTDTNAITARIAMDPTPLGGPNTPLSELPLPEKHLPGLFCLPNKTWPFPPTTFFSAADLCSPSSSPPVQSILQASGEASVCRALASCPPETEAFAHPPGLAPYGFV